LAKHGGGGTGFGQAAVLSQLDGPARSRLARLLSRGAACHDRVVRSLRSAVRWIGDQLGPGARVVRARPLRGGIASVVHDVTVARAGSKFHVVIRRYPGCSDEAARLVAQEAEILQGLVDSAIPAPPSRRPGRSPTRPRPA